MLAGGFGGARMAHGFALLGDEVDLSVIVNTGDDLELHGLNISPDLDTVMYTLAGLANEETGWGVRNETWSAATQLELYGQPTWFRLGDRDLATHIYRTARLHEGARLTEVTRELGHALAISAALLPMTDDPVRTKVETDEGWLDFQDYFVRRHHADAVRAIRFDGIEGARATPEVMAALNSADLVVVAPSNPFVSVAPIVSLPGVLDALRSSSAKVVAVSPIVGGAALRGPAAQIMQSLGGDPTAAGVAQYYATQYPGLLDVLVVDTDDASQTNEIAAAGIEPRTAAIVIPDDDSRRSLARELLELAG